MFTAEIISIGDELTSGALVDTNSAYLSRELTEAGITVSRHATVGDDLPAMTELFRAAFLRSELVLITGGLGPTEDDLTRQAVCEAAGVQLVRSEAAMEHIRRLFEIRRRPMPASNEIQAFFPAGAAVIDNPHGTAPGFELEVDRAPLGGAGRAKALVFPGVPAELKEMWALSGRARALEWENELLGRRRFIETRVFRTFGAGESDVESRLPHLIARSHSPRVGITAAAGVISLRVFAEGADPQECRRQMRETEEVIRSRLGSLVYGEGDDTLASVVCARLEAGGKRLATLEWGTRGALAASVPPSVFAGGLVDSGTGPIRSLLNLSSEASLEETLRRWQAASGAEAVLAVGAFPETGELSLRESFPVPVAALLGGVYRQRPFAYGFHPSIVKPVFVSRAFDLLREMLG